MRHLRRQIPPLQRKIAGQQLARLATHFSILKRHQRIAVYFSNDGEIPTQALVRRLQKIKRQVFLPILHPLGHNSLWFCLFNDETRLVKNRYGIPEPPIKGARVAAAWTLSLVFTPLVAFDGAGNRIGMGGGFYDRTFDRRRIRTGHPGLTGLAYHFQEVSDLPAEYWDTPLTTVVTDRKRHVFNRDARAMDSGPSARPDD
jgi:5-formyltetrahydrofolate cyclo-ligase